jgi:hypothetical protein
MLSSASNLRERLFDVCWARQLKWLEVPILLWLFTFLSTLLTHYCLVASPFVAIFTINIDRIQSTYKTNGVCVCVFVCSQSQYRNHSAYISTLILS